MQKPFIHTMTCALFLASATLLGACSAMQTAATENPSAIEPAAGEPAGKKASLPQTTDQARGATY